MFALVTEKRFVGLEPDYDSGDQPVLVGVRESGEKVALAGMSDGTQDQLYLALQHVIKSNKIPDVSADSI